MSNTALTYVPSIYKNFIEMRELINVEDRFISTSEDELKSLIDNQFVLTANAQGISEYERILGIISNPVNESAEFRRQRIINRLSMTPPFTMKYLGLMLDESIGLGKWEAYVDFDTHTLYVESLASSQAWFNEISVTIGKIKPANIVFVNKPYLVKGIALAEEISYNTIVANYSLGVSWVLGAKPFADYGLGGMIKLSNAKSIKNEFLADVAEFTAQDISKVLLNDIIEISDITTQCEGNIATLEYVVSAATVPEITNIKLLNVDSEVLTESVVFVPMVEDVTMKHTISVKEVV